MKLGAWGFCALLLAGTVGLDRSRSDEGKTRNETTTAVGLAHIAGAAVNLADFAEQVAVVEGELAETTGFARDDLLARYGRSATASGRFDLAAAAYAMFLAEFGTEHPYGERIATRLADCLFPFNYRQVDVVHTAAGPQLHPAWRMESPPRPERLRQAVRAYELVASITSDRRAKGAALLKLGWVHRVLDNWEASTVAWDRCANEAAGTKSGADALWLAAKNLAWTGRPAASSERLRRMAADYPKGARSASVAVRIEHLEAEARRSADWLEDPVASLQAEIETRSATRTPSEVYRSVVKWLGRRGERTAMIAVSRWACTQGDWPVDARVACRYDLVDALLLETGESEASHREAGERLGEIVDFAPGDSAAVPAAIHRYRLLNELGQADAADQVMDDITARVRGCRRWEPAVLAERIESLLERGDKDDAKAVYDTLVETYPDYDVHERFDAAFARTDEEGSK
jgi:tetratricopeptide (TPR) repeat protein